MLKLEIVTNGMSYMSNVEEALGVLQQEAWDLQEYGQHIEVLLHGEGGDEDPRLLFVVREDDQGHLQEVCYGEAGSLAKKVEDIWFSRIPTN